MHFCTIITSNFLPYAEALAASLRSQKIDFCLHTLVSDEHEISTSTSPEIVIYGTKELCNNGLGKSIHDKYLLARQFDEFRWSMKSVMMLYLLQQPKIDKVVFVDPDIAFFRDPGFLFDKLDTSSVLLTPHWRSHIPHRDPSNFIHLQTSGLYNAGFVGARQDAQAALTWWGETCLYRCEKSLHEGLFDDQAYLNMLPIYFDNVEVLRHRGCNVANWNIADNRRMVVNGEVRINGVDPIVFIHFTGTTVVGILRGRDPYLKPYLDLWLKWRGVTTEAYANQLRSPAPSFQRRVWNSLRRRAAGSLRTTRALFLAGRRMGRQEL